VLSANQIADAVRRGELSPAALIEERLAQIDAIDGRLQAWVEVDAAGARAAAAAIEAGGRREDALLGVSVGIKDIFDVAGLPTRSGASSFAHRAPDSDATVVRRLREAGAIVLGKTQTTEFAFLDPAPTHNPWDLEHTPGGSSSGSAAAVAAGMVPIAIGSQTVGSTLRPAAYCGVVGLKPAYGRVSLAGAFPLAPSLDHTGIISRTVRDAALVLGVIAGPDPADPRTLREPIEDYVAATSTPRAPVLGLPRRFFREAANPEVCEHIEDVAGRFAAAGATVREVETSITPQTIRDLGQPVLRAEAAAVHATLFAAHATEYRPQSRILIETGQAVGAVEYIQARDALHELRDELCGWLGGVDALLMPAAPTTAPPGLASTGDGIFCAPASFTGLPAIALPSGLSSNGLPFSVQLIARPLDEARLLSVAAWAERILDFTATPALAAP
jgi:Asp-tRNA(Asn)/Glu-tRNA(Gln) amidotransferase A subunit family amidase